MRFVMRLGAYAMMVWSIVVAGIDGTASVAAGRLRYTALSAALERLSGVEGVARLRSSLSASLHPFVWDGMVGPLLPVPFALALLVAAAALWLFARERRPDFVLTSYS